MAKKTNYTYTVGRRRTSSARIRLFQGKGQNIVNEIPLEKYFPGEVNKSKWSKPFSVTETSDKYYFSAKVVGGGKQGQLDAVIHGLSKALAKIKPDKFRIPLKKVGLLTRDSRIRERRKIGMGGKARRKKQSPKR
ncbi:MAG: 30S ribosomal protein S9 [Patescibacteria group bacterium]